jgi:hypothetical protein
MKFHRELAEYARQMVNPPDEFSIRTKFVEEFPYEAVQYIVHNKCLSFETSSADEILSAALEWESGDRILQTLQQKKAPKASAWSIARARTAKEADAAAATTTPVNSDATAGGIATKSSPTAAKATTGAKPRLRDDSKVECWDCREMGHRAGDPKCKKPKGEPKLRAARVLEREQDSEKGFANEFVDGSQYDSAEELDVTDDAELNEAMGMGQVRLAPMRLLLTADYDELALRAQRMDDDGEDDEIVAQELLTVPEIPYGTKGNTPKKTKVQGEKASKAIDPRSPWIHDLKL